MIRPEQLAAGLQRLDPRDRELLSLSLHRRVPDDDLAKVYELEPADVARRRAAAIEQLADVLEVQRGEDLGSVLRALLEPATWLGFEGSFGEEFGAGAPRARVPEPADPPLAAEAPEPLEAVEPASAESASDGSPADVHELPVGELPEPAPTMPGESESSRPEAVEEPEPRERVSELPEPVDSGDPSPDDAPAAAPADRPVRRGRSGALVLAALGAAALVGASAVFAATQLLDEDSGSGTRGEAGGGTRSFVPAEGGPLAAPFASDPATTSCYATAYLRNATVLYREPGGEPRLRTTRRTEWGSPRVLGVVSQRGDWLGVQAAELRNDEVAWIPKDRARVDCVRWSLHADLSRRLLYVRRDGHTVRKFRVAIGSPGHTTPLGRFSVTDKLEVTADDSPYGCCVLALSGHQTRLPADWPGGDRLAVHATADLESIGKAISLGCMRAESSQARWLIKTIPLGAPIFVRS